MKRSIRQAMLSPRLFFRNAIAIAAMLTAVELSGCGNTCFVAVSNNGNGSVLVVASNPPPTCSLGQATGMMSAVVVKAAVCESCPATARAQHAFVTVRGVQLRPSPTAEAKTAEWVEIAPHLAVEPRQIDLLGGIAPEILVENASVPAGSYSEVRLQFETSVSVRGDESPAPHRCGTKQENCLVMADGRVLPLRLPGDASELLLPYQKGDGYSFVILPEARMELQLSLQSQPTLYSSTAEGWKLQNVLNGSFTVVRKQSSSE